MVDQEIVDRKTRQVLVLVEVPVLAGVPALADTQALAEDRDPVLVDTRVLAEVQVRVRQEFPAIARPGHLPDPVDPGRSLPEDLR